MWRRISDFVSARRFRQAGERFALRGAAALVAVLLFAGCFVVSAQGAAATATNTVLTSSETTISAGSALTLTATVTTATGGAPVTIGQVTFLDGPRVLGSTTVRGAGPGAGVAKLVTSSFGAGTHSLTASYWGAPFSTSQAQASSSAAVPLTVTTTAQGASTVTLTPSASSNVSGALNLTATVTGSAAGATGTVSFSDTSTDSLLGSAALTKGLGTFLPQPPLGLLLSATAIAAADVNGDGFPDLIVGYGTTITFLLNTPTAPGQFSASPATYTTVASADSIVPADVNGDGTVDIVLFDYSTVSILFGDPANPGQFQNEADYSMSGVSGGVLSVADVNGDGLVDIIITVSNGSGGVSTLVLYGDPANPGHFLTTNPATAGTEVGPTEFAASSTFFADLNGDGMADKVTATAAGGCGVLAGKYCPGAPGFVTVAIADTAHPGNYILEGTYTVGIGPVQIAAGDFNADAQTDLVVFNNGELSGPSINLLFGQSTEIAQLTDVTVSPGDLLSATYSGDSVNKSGSSSPAPPAIVTSLLLLPQAPFVPIGSSVLLEAVASAAGGSAPPAGSVTFYDGSTALGTATLDGNGNASLTVPGFSSGMHSIYAEYAGAGFFLSSASVTIGVEAFGSSNPKILNATRNPVPSSDGQLGTATATLVWNAPAGVTSTALVVGAPNGAIMAEGSPSGSETTGPWVTEGMTFYLQDTSGGKPLTAPNTLATFTAHLASYGLLTAIPNPLLGTPSGNSVPLGMTTLFWNSPAGVTDTALLVGPPPDGVIMTQGSTSGNEATGLWVTDGMTFYLQDISGGKALTAANTLDAVTVHVQQPVLFSASPDPITSTTSAAGGPPTGTTTLTWNAPNSSLVEISTSVYPELLATGGPSGTVTLSGITDGESLYLFDASGNTANMLGQVVVHLQQPVEFSASPNPITDISVVSNLSAPGQFEVGETTLSWNAPGVTNTAVLVGPPPDGPIMTEGGPTGSEATGLWAQDGMTFYLQDISGGKPLTAANTLATTTVHLQHQAQFTATPNPIANPVVLGGVALGVTTLNWVVTGVGTVEIHIGAPDGVLFSGGGATGSATTGLWTTDGMTFYLQDVTGGKPLTAANTLGVVTVQVE